MAVTNLVTTTCFGRLLSGYHQVLYFYIANKTLEELVEIVIIIIIRIRIL